MAQLANGETVNMEHGFLNNAEALEAVEEGDEFVAGNAGCGFNQWKAVDVHENDRGTVFVEAKATVGHSPGKTTFVAHSRRGRVTKKGVVGQHYSVKPLPQSTETEPAETDEKTIAEVGDRVVLSYESNHTATKQSKIGHVEGESGSFFFVHLPEQGANGKLYALRKSSFGNTLGRVYSCTGEWFESRAESFDLSNTRDRVHVEKGKREVGRYGKLQRLE